jgi:hypothetical protein
MEYTDIFLLAIGIVAVLGMLAFLAFVGVALASLLSEGEER